MAKITVLGFLGKDAEVRTLESGRVVSNFSLAENLYKKNEKGEKQDFAQWYNCSLFSQNENLSEYLKKGAQVLVFGELRIEEFKSDTGNMVKISNITVLSIDIVKFVENQQNTNKEN